MQRKLPQPLEPKQRPFSRGEEQKVFVVRNKDKVEIDFLMELPNKRFIAVEVKNTPQDLSREQLKLLEVVKR